MKKRKLLLLVVVALSFLGGYSRKMLLPEKQIDEKAYLQEMSPDELFSEKKGNPPHFESDSGIVAFNTYDIVPSVRGYAGPIKTLLVLDRKGKIAGIALLDHKETENYVHYMESEGYLQQFIGKSINDPFEVDRDIDGISRATVSVEALATSVRKSSRFVASQILKIDVRREGTKKRSEIGWLLYAVLFLFSFTLYFLTRSSRYLLRTRDVSLFVSILLVGFYLSSPFSLLHIFNLFFLRPSSSLLWYIIVFSTVLSVAIAGRFYCGWLCPFGALAEFIGRLPLRKWDISRTTDDTWRELKYIIVAVAATAVFVSGNIDYGNYETYITFFSFHGNYVAWSLVIVTLAANLKMNRFWCRYLCPVAAVTGMCSRKNPGYVSRYDCPMGNKTNPLISECIRCNRCYQPPEHGKITDRDALLAD